MVQDINLVVDILDMIINDLIQLYLMSQSTYLWMRKRYMILKYFLLIACREIFSVVYSLQGIESSLLVSLSVMRIYFWLVKNPILIINNKRNTE